MHEKDCSRLLRELAGRQKLCWKEVREEGLRNEEVLLFLWNFEENFIFEMSVGVKKANGWTVTKLNMLCASSRGTFMNDLLGNKIQHEGCVPRVVYKQRQVG